MNSLERVKAAIAFQTPDRTPVIAQVFGHAAVLAGVPLEEYVRDGKLLARSQIKSLRHYGYDAVFALMDVSVETEALGSKLLYRSNCYPTVQSHIFENGVDLDACRIPDPQTAGRMPELLKAAGILRREVGDDILVVGCVLGPMTLAVQLMGAETALYLAIDDPEHFERLLDFAADVAIRFGKAQLEAGAHLPIVFDPSSSPDFIPAAFYRELVLPRVKRVFSALKQAGCEINWLHTAGPVETSLSYYPSAGVNLANIDYCVSLSNAVETLPNTCLNGNIKPLSFVDGNSEEIAATAGGILNAMADRGGFILSSGCEIPPESKPENIVAMVSAASREPFDSF
jgi:uroporphyrinogen decarboxylase